MLCSAEGDEVVAVASMQNDPIVAHISELFTLGKMLTVTAIKAGKVGPGLSLPCCGVWVADHLLVTPEPLRRSPQVARRLHFSKRLWIARLFSLGHYSYPSACVVQYCLPYSCSILPNHLEQDWGGARICGS